MAEVIIRPQNVLDEIELTRLCNLIPSGATYDTAKMRAACALANGQAEAYIQTAYTLPLAIAYPNALIHHTTVLAVYWLHSQSDQVTEAVETRWKETIRWFEKVAKGQISLGTEPVIVGATPDFEEVSQDFSRDEMRKL